MKEIVERILKQERLAQEIIEKARRESDGVIQQSRKEARDILTRSAEDTASNLENKRQASQKEFMRQKEEELQKVRDEVAGQVDRRSKDIPAIAQKLFTRIVSIQE